MRLCSSDLAAALCAVSLLGTAAPVTAQASEGKGAKIPITTASAEAKDLYLKGRDLTEKLRATDARAQFQQAVAKDPAFALAHLGLANTAGTAKEFFDALERAKTLTGKASEAERWMIEGADAGARGLPDRQKECFTKLVAAYPSDERAHNLLGGYHFGRQEWAAAIAAYEKSIAIDPAFSQPYNQLGYAYRFLGRYADAEKAFQKYIQLIPGDPNPYDSYAELLMKMGKFRESIEHYEKALGVDPNFVASYIGIGNNQMFMGRTAEARASLAKLAQKARNDGERRAAHFWTAMSYVHDGDTDKAVAEVEKMAQIAQASGDLAALSGDYNQMGDILLEAGRVDAAAAKYAEQMKAIDKANVPAEVRQAAHRNGLYDEVRVALARNDVAAASAKAAEYARQVAVQKIPFEVWQQHEAAGRVALAKKDWAAAAAALQQANQQDPRVLYLLATALQGKGDAQKAREAATQAADWNALAANYAYVRAKAKKLVAGG
jgi:tetratricopeptide (TPR) repeat protein